MGVDLFKSRLIVTPIQVRRRIEEKRLGISMALVLNRDYSIACIINFLIRIIFNNPFISLIDMDQMKRERDGVWISLKVD